MTATRPATSRQLDYLRALAADRVLENGLTMLQSFAEEGEDADAFFASLSTRTASTLIDTLLKRPRQSWAATPTGSTETTERPADPPVGIHYVDGVIFKVKPNQQKSRVYAKRLVLEPRGWEYVGRTPFDRLSESTLITPDQAREFGTAHGVCANCGKDLTDPTSVENGIGPVCARRLGIVRPRGLTRGGLRDESVEPAPRRTRRRTTVEDRHTEEWRTEHAISPRELSEGTRPQRSQTSSDMAAVRGAARAVAHSTRHVDAAVEAIDSVLVLDPAAEDPWTTAALAAPSSADVDWARINAELDEFERRLDEVLADPAS